MIVQPQPNDIVINKNTWSLFVGTNVELLLRNSGRYTVVFTGIATDIGIETSARHALVVGDFRTYLKSRLTCALPR